MCASSLSPTEQKVYAQLFEKYDGKRVTDDTHEFLENYERIVRLIGKSFPNTGIEILLHNLADPAHSLITSRKQCDRPALARRHNKSAD